MTAGIERRYVERHFWTIDELAEATGTSVGEVRELIAAGCAPGPIYVLGENLRWSALERRSRRTPPGVEWFSPGAAWGLRRARLATRGGASRSEAAALLKRTFEDAFVRSLDLVEGASLAFPSCFVAGEVDVTAARHAAAEEWEGWLGGGYGVCLRVFTGWTCVAKEAIAAAMRTALDGGRYDPDQLLRMAEALAGLVLPFAPWQRAGGTPGRTIDRILSDQDLGSDRAYARIAVGPAVASDLGAHSTSAD